MSRTIAYKGRRIDFDLWQYPGLSEDLDFDLLAQMVTGQMVPSVHFEQGLISHHPEAREIELDSRDNFQFAVGAALATWGTAMLIPGPVDLAVFALGTAVGGPVGGVVAVVIYNAFALVVLATGLILMYTA